MSESEVEIRIRAVILEVTDVDASQLTDNARLGADLGVDSLTRMDLLNQVEDEFKISFPDEEVEGLESVRVIADRVTSLRA